MDYEVGCGGYAPPGFEARPASVLLRGCTVDRMRVQDGIKPRRSRSGREAIGLWWRQDYAFDESCGTSRVGNRRSDPAISKRYAPARQLSGPELYAACGEGAIGRIELESDEVPTAAASCDECGAGPAKGIKNYVALG